MKEHKRLTSVAEGGRFVQSALMEAEFNLVHSQFDLYWTLQWSVYETKRNINPASNEGQSFWLGLRAEGPYSTAEL